MSNNQMVSVPRDLLETTISCAWDFDKDGTVAALQDWLDNQAEQHQGEPVVLPARKKTTSGLLSDSNTHNRGWNACLDEIDKLGPLYTHAEVEPAPECFCVEHGLHIEDLKAQLAEAHTLLREIHDGRISGHERWLKIEAALSASAEPIAPIERDERAAFERAIVAEWPQAPLSRKRDLLPKDDPCYGDYCDEPLQRAWLGWRMRAWLEGSKPTVLSKCVLCDQLQADLTARDEQIDRLRAPND